MYRPGGASNSPGGASGYVPGGGQVPQPTTYSQPEQAPQQRPLGSLQRRLQRSQASLPGDDDDEVANDGWDESAWRDHPPARPGERAHRSRPLGDDRGAPGPRRSSSSGPGGYGDRGRRSHPLDGPSARRGSRGGAGGRSRDDYDDYDGYDRYDESREAPAYSPYPAYDPVDSRSDWDDSREAPAPRRYSNSDRYHPMDESAEMSAEGPAYEPPRSPAPGRRSRPMDGRRDSRTDRDDYTNPLDDPRSPLRGNQGRRPSQGGIGRGGRPSGGYPPAGAGYTEGEMQSPDYRGYRERYDDRSDDRSDDYGRAGFSDERRGRDGRGRHTAAYGREDDYASREGWAVPGGPDSLYPPYEPYDPMEARQSGRQASFDNSAELWQPVGIADRAGSPASPSRQSGARRSGDAKPTKKRKGGAVRMAVSLISTLVLIAVLGVEFGPKVYHLILSRGVGNTPTQSSVTCATETTPSSQTKPPSGSTAFATTAYTLTYPSGWQRNMQSSSTQGQCDVVFLFSQPSGAARFNVEEAGAFTSLNDLQVIQAEAQSAQQQGSTFTEITSAATTQKVGGEVWQRREYQVTAKSGVKLHLALLATHHKGAGFAIVLLSSDASFSSDDTTTFEPMLHAFQFV